MNHKPDPSVDRANTEVSIFDVLSDFFDIEVPRDGEGSYKSYCPFNFEHSNPADRAWRTYPATNTSYCFESHGSMGPVRLIALHKEWSYSRAAKYLLDHYGLSKPKPYRERYQQLLLEREQKKAAPINAVYIVEALNMYLRRSESYDPTVMAEPMEKALGELDLILESGTGEDAVRAWYEKTKRELTALTADS